MNFLAISGCETHFKSKLRRNQINRDKLRKKFSALNVDFNGPSLDFFRFKETCARGHQRTVPSKKSLFFRCRPRSLVGQHRLNAN